MLKKTLTAFTLPVVSLLGNGREISAVSAHNPNQKMVLRCGNRHTSKDDRWERKRHLGSRSESA